MKPAAGVEASGRGLSMRRFWFIAVRAAALTAGLFLAACVTNEARFCVPTGVLTDAADVVVHLPPRADGRPRDIDAAITDAEITCVEAPGRVDSDVTIRFLVTRTFDGPAMNVDLLYFVAIVESGQDVTDKEVYVQRARFETGQRSKSVTVTHRQTFPPPVVSGEGSYEIVVGLQLDPRQLEENRRRQFEESRGPVIRPF